MELLITTLIRKEDEQGQSVEGGIEVFCMREIRGGKGGEGKKEEHENIIGNKERRKEGRKRGRKKEREEGRKEERERGT